MRIATEDGESIVAWYQSPAEGQSIFLFFDGAAADLGRALAAYRGRRRGLSCCLLSRLSRFSSMKAIIELRQGKIRRRLLQDFIGLAQLAVLPLRAFMRSHSSVVRPGRRPWSRSANSVM